MPVAPCDRQYRIEMKINSLGRIVRWHWNQNNQSWVVESSENRKRWKSKDDVKNRKMTKSKSNHITDLNVCPASWSETLTWSRMKLFTGTVTVYDSDTAACHSQSLSHKIAEGWSVTFSKWSGVSALIQWSQEAEQRKRRKKDRVLQWVARKESMTKVDRENHSEWFRTARVVGQLQKVCEFEFWSEWIIWR